MNEGQARCSFQSYAHVFRFDTGTRTNHLSQPLHDLFLLPSLQAICQTLAPTLTFLYQETWPALQHHFPSPKKPWKRNVIKYWPRDIVLSARLAGLHQEGKPQRMPTLLARVPARPQEAPSSWWWASVDKHIGMCLSIRFPDNLHSCFQSRLWCSPSLFS